MNRLQAQKGFIHNWIQRSIQAASLPSDTQAQRLRKAILILLAGIYSLLGLLWGGGYLALGLPLSGSFPLGYSIISGASLFYFFHAKHYKFFCRTQLGLILILPFFLQWSLGGYAASGAVIIWAILAPIGALMFAGPFRSVPWFLAYLLLMAISGPLSGPPSSKETLPPVIVVVSFVMNIGGVSAISFFLLRYFVQGREQAMADLEQAHRRVRHSLSLAMEVQQNLLPKTDPDLEGLDIAGKSVYCDETGGDYYDFLNVGGDGRIDVVVGDVSEHGISSALLMATARAFIRQRASLCHSIDEVVSDVNRQLARDVKDSGRFMTLFYIAIHRQDDMVRWINAGHEPAIVYDASSGQFEELTGGEGLPLGILDDRHYRESRREIRTRQIIVLSTDGIWEARNPAGEMFGRDRIYDVIRRNATASANKILEAAFETLGRFRKERTAEDDMTLVVIKIEKKGMQAS